MIFVEAELDRVRSSSARLVATVSALDATAMRAPSLLPGWSRAHVVVHLSRNADAQVRMIDGALRGERVEQYAGGEQGREQEIEAGAVADPEAIAAGLKASVSALEQRWATLPEEAWALETVTLRFRRSVREGIAARWREVEIHHVDVGSGYAPADWSAEFVDAFLERTINRLPSRLPAASGGAAFQWRLVDQDTERSWLVDAQTVRPGTEDAGADAVISGSGWRLLAWMCGRGEDGLVVSGRVSSLPDLPAYG